MDIQTEALRWLDQGVTPLRIMPGTKRTIGPWRRWQNRLPPSRLVRRWFSSPDVGLGLACGGTRNLVVLDFDSIPLWVLWRDRLPDLADTHTVATARGRHAYFFIDDIPDHFPSSEIPGLDLLGPGRLAIAPPTVHPSGAPYRAISQGPVISIPELPAVLDVLSDLAEPGVVQPTSYDEQAPFVGLLQRTIIERIKATLPIHEYLASIADLRSTSQDGRWWMCNCPLPWHEDRHPSFWLDAIRQRCSCFVPWCRRKQPLGTMDVVDLHSAIRGIPTREAVRELAGQVL